MHVTNTYIWVKCIEQQVFLRVPFLGCSWDYLRYCLLWFSLSWRPLLLLPTFWMSCSLTELFCIFLHLHHFGTLTLAYNLDHILHLTGSFLTTFQLSLLFWGFFFWVLVSESVKSHFTLSFVFFFLIQLLSKYTLLRVSKSLQMLV